MKGWTISSWMCGNGEVNIAKNSYIYNFKLLNSLKEQGRSDYSRLMKRKILNTSFGYSDKE